MVCKRKAAFAAGFADCFRRCADEFQKGLVGTGIRSQAAHVYGSTGMTFCIKTVRSYKICLVHAQFRSFCIHHSGKALHTVSDVLCNGDSGVVVGLQHKRVQQVAQKESFSFSSTEADFRHRGGFRGKCDGIFQITIFQGKDTSHDFCGARHGKGRGFTLSI